MTSWRFYSIQSHSNWRGAKKTPKTPESSSSPQINHLKCPTYLPHPRFQAQGPVRSRSMLSSLHASPWWGQADFHHISLPTPFSVTQLVLVSYNTVRSGFNFHPSPSSVGHTRSRHPTGSSPCGTSENLHFYSSFHPKRAHFANPIPYPRGTHQSRRGSETQNNAKRVQGKISTPT